jgi:hypothetical protein
MGEEKIGISDQGKEVKVQFNTEFEDVDLLSDAEREALKADIDGEGDGTAGAGQGDDAAADAKAAADKAAADKAEADEKAAADAKAAADDQAKKETADAEALKAKEEFEGETGKKATEEGKAGESEAKLVPDTAPALLMQGLTEDDLKKVNDGLEDVKKKFSDGEIDYNEYLDARDAFNQQLWAHNLAMQVSSDSVDTKWEWEQETFLSDEKNDWINSDEVVYPAFAATVNRIMATEEGAVMPGPQLLAMAREEVAKRFSPAQQEQRVSAEEEKKKNDALQRAKDAEAGKQVPETLGGKPTAEIDDGVAEFEWLDKLEGEKYEQAVNNLTEQQLARYEAAP